MHLGTISSLVTTLAAAPAAAAASVPGPGAGDLLSLAGSLVVVIASILAFGWVYARLKPGLGGEADLIRVVATRPLGAKERLVIVEVADCQLLIGVSPGGMQTLHTLDEPVNGERGPAVVNTGFSRVLRAFTREAPQ